MCCISFYQTKKTIAQFSSRSSLMLQNNDLQTGHVGIYCSQNGVCSEQARKCKSACNNQRTLQLRELFPGDLAKAQNFSEAMRLPLFLSNKNNFEGFEPGNSHVRTADSIYSPLQSTATHASKISRNQSIPPYLKAANVQRSYISSKLIGQC